MKYIYTGLSVFYLLFFIAGNASAQCTFGLAAEVQDASTCSSVDGFIDVIPMSGTPPFSYSWSNSATTSHVSNLAPGRYTVIATDSVGCIAHDTFYVVGFPAVTASVVQTISCYGGTNGSIKAAGQCGLRNATGRYYQYKWYKLSGSTGALLSSQIDSVATGLDAGTYYSVIKDANNDTSRSANVVLSQPSRIIPSVAITAATCSASGSVTIGAAGGTATYSFAQGAGTYSSSGTFSGLASGTYTFHIKDAANCIQDTTVTISQPATIGVSAATTQVTCFGSTNGSVTITVTGGTPGYTFAQGAGAYTASSSFSNLASGTYLFHTKDAAGCIKDTTITISQPSRIIPGASVTNILCNGNATGAVTLTAAGGTGSSYTYAKGAGLYSSTATFTAQSAGTYAFHIKDAGGCIQDTIITLTEQSRIVTAAVVTGASCSSGTNGAVTLSATGGTATYTFAQGAGSYGTSGSFTGLSAGTYTFHVKDAAGCIRDTILTIAQPATISVSATSVQVTCFGGSNGSVTITASGGTSGYTYARDAGAYIASPTFGSLSAGSYVFHTKDAGGCIKDTAITISQPSGIVPSASVTPVACNGSATGTVVLSATGGTGSSYTYAQGAGAYSASGTFNGQSAGTYTFHVKDGAGCIKDTTLTIVQPASIVVSATVTQVSCYTGSNGSVVIAASGGTPGYTYARDADAYSASSNFTSLAAGTYIFHTKDAGACIKDTIITISQPSRIIPAVAVTNVTCFGDPGGSVTVSAGGGTSPYNYAKDAGPYGSSGAFTALTAGTYTFHVKDTKACIQDTIITITQPTRIIPAATVTPVLCNGGTSGNVTLSAAGGTGSYMYSKGTGTYTSSGTFSGMSSGTYIFHVKDGAGCIHDTTLMVTQPTAVAVSATVSHVSCYGGNNGSISITATGGTTGYTYALNTATYATANTFTGLIARVDTVHIKDANSCIKDTIITITEPSRIIPSAAITNVTCYGDASGVVTVTATGGSSPYTYAKDAGTYGSASALTALAAGNYTFHVKDATGCIRDTIISVTQPTRIVPAASVINVSCKNGTNGSVTLSAIGGTAGTYTYALGTGAYASNATFNGLSAGTYTFHVKDGAGCVRDTTLTVTEPPLLTLALSATPVSCYSGTNGSATATVAGGTTPYAYLWTNGGTIPALSSVVAGTYGLMVTDAAGCTANGTTTVTSPDSIRLPGVITAPSCFGFCNGSIVLSPIGGTTPYNYSWNNSASTKDLSSLCAGTYTLTLHDANNCVATDSFKLINPAAVTVNAGPDRLLCGTGTLTLKPVTSDSSATFHWTSSIAGFSADTARLVVSQVATYYVTVSAHGCSGSDTVIIGQTSDDFNAEFLASTQAFKDSVFSLVNISTPEPDSVIWGLPTTSSVVTVSRSKYLAEVIFRDTGVYVVSMIGRKGQCEKIMEDNIVVIAGQPYIPIAGSTKRPHIKVFTIAPNPNSGQFHVHIELEEEGPVRLRLLSLLSSGAVDDRQDSGKKIYDFPYNLTLSSGQYLLLLETGRGSQSLKLTVQ